MKIKLPGIRLIRPQQYYIAAEGIIIFWLKIALPLSFIGCWQIYQWIKPYYELVKPLLEKLQ